MTGLLLRVLLAVGVVTLLRRLFVGYRHRPLDAVCLSSREWATIAAAADATFPEGGALAPSGREAGVPEHVDRFVAAQQPSTRILMKLLFLLVEQATLLFPAPGPGGRRRFSALSREQRVRVLEDWRSSPLFVRRLVFTSLRAILTMGYLADAEVMRLLGLAPPEIERRVCEADLLWGRIGEPSSAVRFRREDLSAPVPVAPLAVAAGAHGLEESGRGGAP